MAQVQTTDRPAPPPDDPRSSLPALVLFADIRGFTHWSGATEVFAHLSRFVSSFLAIIRRGAPRRRRLVKGLGDGAMVVLELTPETNRPDTVLVTALGLIERVEREFHALCAAFAREVGHRTELRLGWGVVRGEVKRLPDGDYVGSNVNKAARLCDAARPFGVVLDWADFPGAGDIPDLRFHRQTRRLTGLAELDVWVTDAIFTYLAPREHLRETPEVHVAGMCVEPTARGLRLLVARRAADRRLFPRLYEGCGGQLRLSETFAEGVTRHFRLEMGIEVRVLEDYHCLYDIREPDRLTIPGIRFLCEPVGPAEPRSPNHSEGKWISEAEFRDIPDDQFVGGLKAEVVGLIDRYKADRRERPAA